MASHKIFSVTPRLQCPSLPCDRTIKPPIRPAHRHHICFPKRSSLGSINDESRTHTSTILHTSGSHILTTPSYGLYPTVSVLDTAAVQIVPHVCGILLPDSPTASHSFCFAPARDERNNLGREGPDLEIVKSGAIPQGYRYSLTQAPQTNPVVWTCFSFAFTNPVAPDYYIDRCNTLLLTNLYNFD